MNDVSQPDSIPTLRRPKAVRVRTYRAALQEPGASRLTAEELEIVTQALVILENKVVRNLKPNEIMKSPERVKQWLLLHYGMLDREVFGLIFLDLCGALAYVYHLGRYHQKHVFEGLLVHITGTPFRNDQVIAWGDRTPGDTSERQQMLQMRASRAASLLWLRKKKRR
jgi:hypothetical protein